MSEPITHTEVVARIPAATRAQLQVRDDGPALWHLAGHMAVLGVTGLWIWMGWFGWPLVILVHGIVFVFLFTLQHESAHDTAFATLRLNRIVGHVIGVAILNPFHWFRLFHQAHHRHTNDPERDPELLSGAKPETRAAFWWHVTGLPVWAGAVRMVLRHAMAPPSYPYVPERARPRLRTEARVACAVYAVAGLSLFYTPAVLWLWWGPMLVGQPVLRLYLLAEHGRCPAVANMLENTRTTYTTHVVRWLAWNMPFHIEHHAVPNVPFHRLPELHRHMAPHLISTAPGYGAFTRDYVKDLKAG